MRIFFKSATAPKHAAKRLQKILSSARSTSYEWAAYTFGYRNWQELLDHIGTSPASAYDDECKPEELAARRRYQVQRLGECISAARNMSPTANAASIVAKWEPSGRQSSPLSRFRLSVPRQVVERTAVQMLGLPRITPLASLPAELLAKRPASLQEIVRKDATALARKFLRTGTGEEQVFARSVLEYLHTQGLADATKELAVSLATGIGGPVDHERARQLYHAVLDLAVDNAPLKLCARDGLAALDGGGDGWPNDIPAALARWEERALAGSAVDAYRTGLGCDPYRPMSREAAADVSKAARFYRMAAVRGYAPAYRALVTTLNLHPDLATHFNEVQHWIDMAALTGDRSADCIAKLVESEAERLFSQHGGSITQEEQEAFMQIIPENERGDIRVVAGLGEVVPVPPGRLIHLATGNVYRDTGAAVERIGNDRVAMSFVERFPKNGTPMDRAGWVSEMAELFGRVDRHIARQDSASHAADAIPQP